MRWDVKRTMLALLMLMAASHAPLAGVTAQDANFNATLKGAEQGNADAQFKLRLMNYLGLIYYRGEGVTQDYGKARAWFQKAAERGFDQAQFNLGRIYAKGLGVAQDYGKARAWYLKAAEQGFAKAQFSLGNMYAQGRGGRRDFVQAFKWIALSVVQGAKKAAKQLYRIVRQRMAAVLAEAKRFVAERKPKPSNAGQGGL